MALSYPIAMSFFLEALSGQQAKGSPSVCEDQNAIADRHGAGPGSVQVWDFSGMAPETVEGIPPAGDRRTNLRYYWEGGHFKKALGDRVIARILGEPVEFGQQIDSTNIGNRRLEDRRQVLALLATPGPLLTEVADILAHARRK